MLIQPPPEQDMKDFFAACRSNKLDVVKATLKKYPDAALWRESKHPLSGPDLTGYSLEYQTDMTGLMAAAEYGHEDVMALLLNNGADINAVDSRKQNALFHAVNAAMAGHEKAVDLLLDNNINTLLICHAGYTAVTTAQVHGRNDFGVLILEKQAQQKLENAVHIAHSGTTTKTPLVKKIILKP